MDTLRTDDVLDEALEMLEGFGFEYGPGFANHGPMAAEALVAMGRPGAVVGWTQRYRAFLDDPPVGQAPIREAGWADALGDARRVADWEAFLADALEEARWPGVVHTWATRLLPGLAAAAMHGVIRTGHAVRALEQAETPLRRRELARGLAYWAATYQPLPGDPGRRREPSGLAPADAIHEVEALPDDLRVPGLITAGLMALDEWPPFEQVVDLVGFDDPGRALSQLTATFARTYLANAHDALSTIVFVHGVTGPAAARLLLPYLTPADARLAVAYAWQAGAAIYAAFGRSADPGPFDEAADDFEPALDQAVAGGDEHAIKMTEACLREHTLAPEPAFPAAAHHAATMLSPGG